MKRHTYLVNKKSQIAKYANDNYKKLPLNDTYFTASHYYFAAIQQCNYFDMYCVTIMSNTVHNVV